MSGMRTRLTLTRPVNKSVVIRVGSEVVKITVTAIEEHQVRLRFAAAPHVEINREEVDILKFGAESPPEV